MSLFQFFGILYARKAIIGAMLLSCLAAALATSQLLPNRYTAEARVLLDILKPDPVTGELISNSFVRAYTQTQIELIKDPRTAAQVVDQLRWAQDPAWVERYAEATGGEGTDIRQWLAGQIVDATDATLIQGSNILEISVTWNSGEGARQLSDLVRDAYLSESLRTRREAAGRTADWYREQTGKALRLLTAAEAARSRFAKENGIVLQADNSDLESSKLQALAAQAPTGAVAGAEVAELTGPSPASQQLLQIEQQIAQARSTMGANHPAMQALRQQRAALVTEASRAAAVPRRQAPPRGLTAAQIESMYQTQKSRVMAQRDKLDQLTQMQRDIELRREQYLKSAQRAAELRMQADVAEAGLTALGDPVPPQAPSFPNLPLIFAGAISLGLVLGVSVALLIELLWRRIRSGKDLEQASSAPLLAIVASSKTDTPWLSSLLATLSRRREPRLLVSKA